MGCLRNQLCGVSRRGHLTINDNQRNTHKGFMKTGSPEGATSEPRNGDSQQKQVSGNLEFLSAPSVVTGCQYIGREGYKAL